MYVKALIICMEFGGVCVDGWGLWGVGRGNGGVVCREFD